jgi:hypothetical protein
MANRQAQTGFVLRTFTPDQIFSLEGLDSEVFDRILEAVNKGNREVTLTVFTTLNEKREAGYVLTPLTDELYKLAQAKLGRALRMAQ